MEKTLSRIIGLSLLAVMLTLLVLLLGVATRLLDAGLGCPDWPGCYGRLLVPDAEQAAQFSSQPLEPVKAWMEMVHRYAAASLGVLSIVLLLFSLRMRALNQSLWKYSLALLLLVIGQGLFGMWTVTLKLWPVVVTAHLLGGLTCLIGFFSFYWRLREIEPADAEQEAISGDTFLSDNTSHGPVNPLFWLTLVVLVGQITLGGWTSSNYAGIACTGFPQCNHEWWPDADFQQGFHLSPDIGPDYLHGQLEAAARTAIHLSHRVGAMLLGISLMLLYWQQRHADTCVKRSVIRVGVLYGIQLAVAYWLVSLSLPFLLALLHTLMAALILMALVQGGFEGVAWKPVRKPSRNPVVRLRREYGH